MRRVLVVVSWSALLTLASPSSEAAPASSPSVWGVSLFNGRDLSGWDTWLGIPSALRKQCGALDSTMLPFLEQSGCSL